MKKGRTGASVWWRPGSPGPPTAPFSPGIPIKPKYIQYLQGTFIIQHIHKAGKFEL